MNCTRPRSQADARLEVRGSRPLSISPERPPCSSNPCSRPPCWSALSAAPALADISGAGATFPFPIYAKWADAYKKDTGNGLNYQSIGSGAGIKQIKAKTVTFGATDAPLEAEGPGQGRPRPMADGDGRHRDGRQYPGREARRARARRPDCSRKSISARSPSGTIRRSRSSIRSVNLPDLADRHRPSRRRLGHDLQLHLLSRPKSRRNGRSRSARRPPSNGRRASAPRATTASPTTSPRPPARSAMSNTPTPSRTS